MENKIERKIWMGLLCILIVIIIFLSWRLGSKNKDLQVAQVEQLKQEYLAHDSLIKVSAGNYEKLVNYFETQSSLNSDLKNSKDKTLDSLGRIIKKQNDRLLSLTYAIFSLKDTVSKGKGTENKQDSNLMNLSINYPNDKYHFIDWSGTIDRKTLFYNGVWNFGKLPIHIILTEQKSGLWNTNIIGPSWFKLDSLSVNSLPPDQYQNEVERNIEFMIGGGIMKSLDPTKSNAISFNGGISLFGVHYIMAGVNTNNEVMLTYLYKFRKYKKR